MITFGFVHLVAMENQYLGITQRHWKMVIFSIISSFINQDAIITKDVYLPKWKHIILTSVFVLEVLMLGDISIPFYLCISLNSIMLQWLFSLNFSKLLN